MSDILDDLKELDELRERNAKLVKDSNARLIAALESLLKEFSDYHYHGCEEASENCCFAQIILREAREALGQKSTEKP